VNIATLDLVVIGLYAALLLGTALWVSRDSGGHQKDTRDYFLASSALPWWAIGASLIAANISAEQIIGMSGSGYAIGLAIASYEWTAAIALILVGKYLLPIFLKEGIYTMPQFLEKRFDGRVRTLLALFWIGVYVFVNLTSILWLGSLAFSTVTGMDTVLGLWLLGGFAIAYSLYGGLKAVALTDMIQLIVLVIGGLLVAYFALDQVSGGAGAFAGFQVLTERIPEKFDLILSKDNPAYASLPGLSVLIGGMWVMHLSYWGFNQYIIQRALAAKSLDEAQKGIVFAASLKIIMPILVVVPGLAAVVLAPNLAKPDNAYPTMMQLLPSGLLGLVFAGLLAAILSSLASMMNSISTIFTLDLYAKARPGQSEQHLVKVGRLVGFAAMLIAVLIAKPLLGQFDQAFQYIQEFTGFFTPGIVTIFLFGMFWSRMTSAAAITVAILSAALSFALKMLWPTLPFMDRVGVVFLACVAAAVLVSLATQPHKDAKAVDLGSVNFKTSGSFNVAAIGVTLMIAAIYATWW
jgi:solute:Na+ symporter, SSS family